MRYVLRPMEPGDVPVVTAIDRLSFPTPWPPSAFQHELKRERAYYYVLLRPEDGEPPGPDEGWGRWLRDLFAPVKESQIVGYVGFRLQSSEGHITTIAVHPDCRRQGLGDLLLLVALGKLLSLGVDVVTLEMRPSNTVAHQLYGKHGFEVTRRVPKYYRDDEDAWVMAVEAGSETYRRRWAALWRVLDERLRRAQVEIGQEDCELL
jgi:ribosomal-protein-alanine N-acetyltransferase